MSKIICDVCGTSFPDTATQCPICGCVRSADVDFMVKESADNNVSESTYTYVKGGRFSKANVKKRNASKSSPQSGSVSATQKKHAGGSNRGLVITAIVLFLMIVSIILYFVFADIIDRSKNQDTYEPTTIPTKPSTQAVVDPEPVVEDIACEELIIVPPSVELTEVGQSVKLEVEALPSDTTDVPNFVSADPAVATVDDEGNVVAVAVGETYITVTCGDITSRIDVKCNIPVPAEDISALIADGTYVLNTGDGTAFSLYHGASHTLTLRDAEGNYLDIIVESEPTTYCTISENEIVAGHPEFTTNINLTVKLAEGPGDYFNCTLTVWGIESSQCDSCSAGA